MSDRPLSLEGKDRRPVEGAWSTSDHLRTAARVWLVLSVLAALGALACAGLAVLALWGPQPVTALFWLLAVVQIAVPGFAAWTLTLVCAKLAELGGA